MNSKSILLAIIGPGSGGVHHALAFIVVAARRQNFPSMSSLLSPSWSMNAIKLWELTPQDDQYLPSNAPSHHATRRKTLNSILSSSLGAIFVNQMMYPPSASADEPSSNSYYKSNADMEDPSLVFGESLGNMSVDPSNMKDTPPLSFSDITLPPDITTTTTTMSPLQSSSSQIDLNAVLQKKEEEGQKKRAISPLTHG